MSDKYEKEVTIAALYSGRLMRTQALIRAAKSIAHKIETNPGELFGDRDLESLVALIELVGDDFEGLMEEIQKVA
ncbi:MAG: hypothetical protein AAFW60_11795 [Pseudomonadota bacterium]